MSLVQLVQRQAEHLRRPRGEKPVFEFDLLEHERIVGIFHSWQADYRNRETVDHYCIVWVEVRL